MVSRRYFLEVGEAWWRNASPSSFVASRKRPAPGGSAGCVWGPALWEYPTAVSAKQTERNLIGSFCICLERKDSTLDKLRNLRNALKIASKKAKPGLPERVYPDTPGSRLGWSEFHSQLQLQESGSQNRVARIQATEDIYVLRPAIPLRVRVKRGRVQVEGSIEDVPVKGIDGRCAQEDIHPFRHTRSFREVEILGEELGVAHVPDGPGHGTELVPIGTEITAVVGIGECLGVKHRIGHGIEVTAQELRTEDRLSLNQVVAEGSRKRGRARRAAKREWLPALIALDSADLPAANQSIDSTCLIDEVFSFTDRQVVYVAQNEGLRNILVTDGFLALQIERILCTASSVQGCKERQRRIGIRKGLRPRVRRHQAQSIAEPASQGGLEGAVAGLPTILQCSISIKPKVLRERNESLSHKCV